MVEGYALCFRLNSPFFRQDAGLFMPRSAFTEK
jgi:hypothetical protein